MKVREEPKFATALPLRCLYKSPARHAPLLIHVEVALQDTLLHGIGHSGLLWHLAGRLHDGDALGAVVHLGGDRVDGVGAGHGGALGAAAKILGKVVAFAWRGENGRQLAFTQHLIGMMFETVGEKLRQRRRRRFGGERRRRLSRRRRRSDGYRRNERVRNGRNRERA